MRPGGSFRVHIAAPLIFDGTPLAAAGTPARLIVVNKTRAADGTPLLTIALAGFSLKQGELPLIPVTRVVPSITYGMTITAATLGAIERMGDRVVIAVPVPVPLSSSAPSSAYKALPAVTPGPVIAVPRRGATPTPLPTTFNPPEPSETPSDAASGSPA